MKLAVHKYRGIRIPYINEIFRPYGFNHQVWFWFVSTNQINCKVPLNMIAVKIYLIYGIEKISISKCYISLRKQLN